MQILMIDDDHVFAALIGDALKVSGHDVRRVPTTESGIAALLERRYDIVLLDLDLGATRGESMIRRMQGLGERLPPVSILSGQPSGVCRPNAGCPSSPTRPARRGVVSG